MLKFIESEDNHDYVKKPALKILKRDVASQLELQSEGDDDGTATSTWKEAFLCTEEAE